MGCRLEDRNREALITSNSNLFLRAGRWSADGKGIEAALTARELKSVKQPGSAGSAFPAGAGALVKPPVNLFPFSEAEAQAYVPPAPALISIFRHGRDGDRSQLQPCSGDGCGEDGALQRTRGRGDRLAALRRRCQPRQSQLPNDQMLKLLTAKNTHDLHLGQTDA